MTALEARSGSRWLSLRSVVNGLLIAVVIATIGLAALERIVPMTGRTTLIVAGPSMAPALAVGSVVIVEPVDPGALSVGDVVSVRSGPTRAIFTHRITRVVQRDGAVWIETKGDANAAPDPSILPATDVIGRVVTSAPYIGYLMALASRPSGVILILAVGLLLLVSAWILDPKRAANLTQQQA